jgi:hypothetical protein
MEHVPDDYRPTHRLGWSLAAALVIVRCTDHPLVAGALVLAALITIWVWP